LDGQATRNNILSTLASMIPVQGARGARGSPGAQDKELIFFYFSGHGTYTFENQADLANKDEVDGRDEIIVPFDGQLITDDMFYSSFLSLLPASTTLVMIIDACNSGTFADLDFNYTLDTTNPQLLAWTEQELPVNLQKQTIQTKTKATVYSLSASSDNEFAREGYFSRYESYRGYFTVALQENWMTATVNKTLYDYMRSIQTQYLGTSQLSPQTMNISSTERLLSSMTLETLFGEFTSQQQQELLSIKYPSTWTSLPSIHFLGEESTNEGKESEITLQNNNKQSLSQGMLLMFVFMFLSFFLSRAR